MNEQELLESFLALMSSERSPQEMERYLADLQENLDCGEGDLNRVVEALRVIFQRIDEAHPKASWRAKKRWAFEDFCVLFTLSSVEGPLQPLLENFAQAIEDEDEEEDVVRFTIVTRANIIKEFLSHLRKKS